MNCKSYTPGVGGGTLGVVGITGYAGRTTLAVRVGHSPNASMHCIMIDPNGTKSSSDSHGDIPAFEKILQYRKIMNANAASAIRINTGRIAIIACITCAFCASVAAPL